MWQWSDETQQLEFRDAQLGSSIAEITRELSDNEMRLFKALMRLGIDPSGADEVHKKAGRRHSPRMAQDAYDVLYDSTAIKAMNRFYPSENTDAAPEVIQARRPQV